MLVTLFLIPLLTALLCMMPKSPEWVGRLHVLGTLALGTAGVTIIQQVLQHKHFYLFNHAFYLDALSALMILVICGLFILAGIYSTGYMRAEVSHEGGSLRKLKGYYVLLNLFVLAMLISVTTNSLGVFWIGIEATTLVSAFLVGFYNNQLTVEAAWKYIILCAVGIAFALIGILLTYFAVVHAGGEHSLGLSWDYLLKQAPHLDPNLMKVAFVFILIGYGTKAGLAPMHTWLPDAHSEAPTPVSALLSGVLLKCGIYGIVRYSILTNAVLGHAFTQQMLLVFGLLSVAIAAPFILTQHNIKRLLAYSSLEHIGIIVTGLGFGTPLAVFGALFHIINHALVKSLMFFTSGNLILKYKSKQMDHIQGVLNVMPISGAVLLLGGMALAGSPPFSIFMSEFYIFTGGIQGHHWIASIIFLALLVIIFGGLAYHFCRMAIGPSPLALSGEPALAVGEINASSIITIVVPLAAALILAFWLAPPLFNLLYQATHIVLGGSAL